MIMAQVPNDEIGVSGDCVVDSIIDGQEPIGKVEQDLKKNLFTPDHVINVSSCDSESIPETTEKKQNNDCAECGCLKDALKQCQQEKACLDEELSALKTKLKNINNEFEREVQKRCELEQRFSEEAKRSTEQIEELVVKSEHDDARISDLKRKFELYSRENSSMMENFTTDREFLTSQLLELRRENDYLLAKFIGKSRDLQDGVINLPQTVEELQFHCLTLNEKLILATMAKEQLEETLMRNSTAT